MLRLSPGRGRQKQERGRNTPASRAQPVCPAEPWRGGAGHVLGSLALVCCGQTESTEEGCLGTESHRPDGAIWLETSPGLGRHPGTLGEQPDRMPAAVQDSAGRRSQAASPALSTHLSLCPSLFQNKVVTVDGVRVKLQVRQAAGRAGVSGRGAVQGWGRLPRLFTHPQEARGPALSLG